MRRLSSLFGGGGTKATKANLGENNDFYYDEKLKRWVDPSAEGTEEEIPSAPPITPPATPHAEVSGTSPVEQHATNGGPPVGSSAAGPPLAAPPTFAGGPPRANVRSRYVDPFANAGLTSSAGVKPGVTIPGFQPPKPPGFGGAGATPQVGMFMPKPMVPKPVSPEPEEPTEESQEPEPAGTAPEPEGSGSGEAAEDGDEDPAATPTPFQPPPVFTMPQVVAPSWMPQFDPTAAEDSGSPRRKYSSEERPELSSLHLFSPASDPQMQDVSTHSASHSQEATPAGSKEDLSQPAQPAAEQEAATAVPEPVPVEDLVCNICMRDIAPNSGWRCTVREDFDMCNSCRTSTPYEHPLKALGTASTEDETQPSTAASAAKHPSPGEQSPAYPQPDYAQPEYSHSQPDFSHAEYAPAPNSAADVPQAAYPQADDAQAQYPQADFDFPQTQYPQADFDFPEAQFPQAQDPQGDYPQGQHPQSDYPQAQYPQSDYPQAQYPQSDYSQAQYPQGDHSQAQYPQGDYFRAQYSLQAGSGEAQHPVPDYAQGEYAQDYTGYAEPPADAQGQYVQDGYPLGGYAPEYNQEGAVEPSGEGPGLPGLDVVGGEAPGSADRPAGEAPPLEPAAVEQPQQPPAEAGYDLVAEVSQVSDTQHLHASTSLEQPSEALHIPTDDTWAARDSTRASTAGPAAGTHAAPAPGLIQDSFISASSGDSLVQLDVSGEPMAGRVAPEAMAAGVEAGGPPGEAAAGPAAVAQEEHDRVASELLSTAAQRDSLARANKDLETRLAALEAEVAMWQGKAMGAVAEVASAVVAKHVEAKEHEQAVVAVAAQAQTLAEEERSLVWQAGHQAGQVAAQEEIADLRSNLDDLLVCLGQEGSKVQRLRECLEERGAEPDELMADLLEAEEAEIDALVDVEGSPAFDALPPDSPLDPSPSLPLAFLPDPAQAPSEASSPGPCPPPPTPDQLLATPLPASNGAHSAAPENGNGAAEGLDGGTATGMRALRSLPRRQ